MEHPTFINTIAKLTNKNLPKELTNKLMEVHRNFLDINNRAKKLNERLLGYMRVSKNYIDELMGLIEEFLIHDVHFVRVLDELKQYGREDEVWQTLLHHITSEQKFMYATFISLKKQLKY